MRGLLSALLLLALIPAAGHAEQAVPPRPVPARPAPLYPEAPARQMAMRPVFGRSAPDHTAPLFPGRDLGQAVLPRPISLRPVSTSPVGTSRITGVPQAVPHPASNVPADPARLCEAAITTAEYVNRVPPGLLGAISMTESGRPDPVTGRIRPWPWTLNAEDEGHFFATRQDAIAAVQALQARGVQSIDIGCMQVNLASHPGAFTSLEDAFDPRLNADYAARFLNQLYAGSRDWSKAIGAYHSETPALGDAYRVLVLARWQGGTPPDPPPRSPYQDFTPISQVYGAFTHATRVYGAFATH